MRPIMKRLQHSASFGKDSLYAALSCGSAASSASFCSAPTVVAIDKATEFVLHLHCERMISTHFLLRPFLYIVNMNAIMAYRKSMDALQVAFAVNFPRYIEINKNAVILDDIEIHWCGLEEDCTILSSPTTKNHFARRCDDTDLDLSAIHREAQKYNDSNDLQLKLDLFFMQCLLQHIIFYLKDSWPELTGCQRHNLCHFVKPHLNVFDQLTWFGYDCLIRSTANDLIKVEEYSRVLNNISGEPSNNFVVENIAVDFGINFKFSKDIILACDKHFEGCLRKRMAYTKIFK